MNEKTYKTDFRIAEGQRIYAIGDIHGQAKLLDKMHELISMDLVEGAPENIHVVYLGDYVDRGPDSRGVLDRLIERKQSNDNIKRTFLLGNHEQGMIDYIENFKIGSNAEVWLDWGGIETLQSYGIVFEHEALLPSEKEEGSKKLRRIISEDQMAFLKSLDYAIEIDEFFFCHAGVHPQMPLEKQSLKDLFLIREPFLSWPKPLSHMIVHGHTKTKGEPEVLPHRINVDTGAYETGVMTAAVIEGNEARFLQARL